MVYVLFFIDIYSAVFFGAHIGGNERFIYDAIHRKVSQTDQAGITISNSFDMANRLLQRNYPDNLNDVFSYDPVQSK